MYRQFAILIPSITLILACSHTQAQGPPALGYRISALGLTGREYEGPSSNGLVFRYDWAQNVDSSGHVLGYTERYGNAGQFGADFWIYDGVTTKRIGLAGPGYEYVTQNLDPTKICRKNGVLRSTVTGQLAGTTERYTPSGTSLGTDAWTYVNNEVQLIGLTGQGYDYNRNGDPSLPVRSNFNVQVSDTGAISGTSFRSTSTGQPLGIDVWWYSNGRTRSIGLTGGVYDFPLQGNPSDIYRSTYFKAISPSGFVLGKTSRARGSDVWIFDGETTRVIGLIGPDYEELASNGVTVLRSSSPTAINASGQAIGQSAQYGSRPPNQAWFYDGTNTVPIGLAGRDYERKDLLGRVWRDSTPWGLTSKGQVYGVSYRHGEEYDNPPQYTRGSDSWVFSNGVTRIVGLQDGIYVGSAGIDSSVYRASTPADMSDSGKSTGVTQILRSKLSAVDAWYDDGVSTRRIGLQGSLYEWTDSQSVPTTRRIAEARRINERGQVIGTSMRFAPDGTSLGASGWFYDSLTNITTPLVFSVRSTDNLSYTSPHQLTEDGLVLGTYQLFQGATDLGQRGFFWSLETGFHDIGSLVEGGMAASGWRDSIGFSYYNSLADISSGTVDGGAMKYLLGGGTFLNQLPGTSSAFLLTAVIPEPKAMMFVPGLAVFLRQRRWKDKPRRVELR